MSTRALLCGGRGVNGTSESTPELERCGCGAIVHVYATAGGSKAYLEAGRWPRRDLPRAGTWLVVDGVAHRVLGDADSEQQATVEHARACPLKVTRRPSGLVVGELWMTHRQQETKVHPKALAWAAQRRAGVSTLRIADKEGVSHQLVSRATRLFGRYPRPGAPSEATVQKWVQARRRGVAASRIAASDGVNVTRVVDATAPWGPFRWSKSPPGWTGVSGLADRVGVSLPTLLRWAEAGDTPPPDRVERGRRLWRDETVESWVAASNLEACPTCGALAKDVRKHAVAVHR